MREFRRLFRRASKGDIAASNILFAANDRLAKVTNRALREMERKGFDYGAAYNNLTFYTETEFDGRRVKTSKQLEHDVHTVYRQLEEITKFQSYKGSSVEGQAEILENKINVFDNMGIFPKNYSQRTKKQFVRFIANEETREIIEEYGDSETVVRMLRDAFFSRQNTSASLKRSFAQFLAKDKNGAKTFDELMERNGVNVYSDKYRRQQNAKDFFLRG